MLIILVYFHAFLNAGKFPMGDMITAYLPRAENLKQSIERYHVFNPLWTPYWMSGTPFFAKPMIDFGYLEGWLLLIFPAAIALKITYIFDMFFAGVAMYALMIYLRKDPKIAFFSAIIYSFNGWIIGRFMMGHLTTLNGYPFVPLIFLFTLKAFKSDWLKNSIITGILFAIQIRGNPDLKVFLFTAMLFFLYAAFYIIKNPSRALKAFFIAAVVFALCFGFAAQKILPVKEYLDMSSRGHLSFEQSAIRKISINKFFTSLVEPIYKGMPDVQRPGRAEHIGIVAFMLLIFGIYMERNKKLTWFFVATIILSFLLVTGSFVYYFLWKYIPPFDSFHYLDRTLVLYVFAASVLAGIGAGCFLKFIEDKFKLNKKSVNVVFAVLVVLVLVNLAVFGFYPYRGGEMRDINEVIANNYVLQNVSKMPGIFRIQAYETRGIDWGTEFTTVPLKLENIFGYEDAWLPEYMNVYLSYANNQPAKLWGMLNVKYVTSTQLINDSGFRLIGKFKECEICYPEIPEIKKAWGPYLYENEKFLPRAYFVDNSILVIGEKNSVMQTTYALMLNNNFNPSNTVIIMKTGKVQDYSQDFLNKFSAIVLTQDSIDQGSGSKLKNYVDSGKILIPNIIEGKNSISNEEIDDLLSSFKGNLKAVGDENIITNNFDKKTIKVDKKGFIVLSEQYSLYSQWGAKSNGNEIEILRADGAISSVYVENEKEIVFEYRSKTYMIGTVLFWISFVIVLIYFVYWYFLKKKEKKKAL